MMSTAPHVENAPAGNERASAGSPVSRAWAAALYSIVGDQRFLSHHDEMRMLTRALIRARWPIVYSQGFNPQPRFSIAVPRRLGTASFAQLLLVEIQGQPDPSELATSLARQLPAPGCALRAAFAPLDRRAMHARCADFRVRLDASHAASLAPRIDALLASAECPVLRRGAPDQPPRPLDIRLFIESLVLIDAALHMRLAYRGQQSARPVEIVEKLGLPAQDYEHRVELTDVTWTLPLPSACSAWIEPEPKPPAPGSVGCQPTIKLCPSRVEPERNPLGQEESNSRANDPPA